MFRHLAPKLRDMGWMALIPIKPGDKAPAISQWERFNIEPASDALIERWTTAYGGCGIGLCYGPDGVVAVDLDYLDPDKAQQARRNMEQAFGPTPLLRVGQAPKLLGIYRAAPGLHVEGRAFGGFELYAKSGQCLMYGIHQRTGRPYEWIEERPEHVSPEDLPAITQQQLEVFLTIMEPLREDKVTIRGATVHNAGGATTWLQVFSTLSTPEEMIEAGCAGIMGVGAGARHYTMVAVVTALVTRGIEPDLFISEVEDAYTSTLDMQEALARRGAVEDAARWADQRIWAGTVSTPPVSLNVKW